MTTVQISAGQSAIIDDLLSLREDGSDQAFTLRRTSVTASAADLDDIAERIREDAPEAGDAAAGGVFSDSPRAQDFAWITAYGARIGLARKLERRSPKTRKELYRIGRRAFDRAAKL